MTVNLPLGNLAEGLKNKHVSIPAIAAGAAELIQIWNPVWYAAHKEAIVATQRWLLIYATVQASTTTSKPSEETKNALADLQTQVNQVKQDTAQIKKV